MRRLPALLAIGPSPVVVGAAAPSSGATTRLTAVMTGAAERPRPAHPGGSGRAVASAAPGATTVGVVAPFTNLTPAATAAPVATPVAGGLAAGAVGGRLSAA